MKKLILIVIILGIAATAWHYRFQLEKFSGGLQSLSSQLASSTLVSNIKQDISAPGPLFGTQNSPDAYLTRSGVITQTNLQRKANGNLPALKENQILDKTAAAKLNDMFAKQYFEHVSPSGVGPGQLAASDGYMYISEGENLALGNFKDDTALVDAWMNSPGHRANILNNKYTEMGAAVGKGLYQGNEVWLGVQEFGRPQSSCPALDASLKLQIGSLQADINQLNQQLTVQKSQIDVANPQSRADYQAYNQQVSDYNALVKIYNNKVDSLKFDTALYNQGVDAFNKCAAG